MLAWVEQNSGALSVLANFGMLGVWIVYLQLFLAGYRKQRMAKIIINRGRGSGVDSHCLVSNMSAQAVYLQSILVTARTDAGEWTAPVDTAEGTEDELGGRSEPFQGPLLAGNFVDLGPFEKLMYQAIGQALYEGEPPPDIDAVTSIRILIVGIYGPEVRLIGAERSFDILDDTEIGRLRPQSMTTTQLGGRRNRRELERLMRRTYIQ